MSNKSIYIQTTKFGTTLDQKAATIIRHYEARHELGTALVISSDSSLSGLLKKHWKKLIQEVKVQRDKSDGDAAESLRLTNKIIRMQTGHSYHATDEPDFRVVDPKNLSRNDLSGFKTIYIMVVLTQPVLTSLVSKLPNEAMIVSEDPQPFGDIAIRSKTVLDDLANEAWTRLADFLKNNQVKLSLLSGPNPNRSEHINDALDTLLDSSLSNKFLALVSDYRAAALLAAPIIQTNAHKREHQTVGVLARQVQTFSGHFYSHNNLGGDGIDPTFFLNDNKKAANRAKVHALIEQIDHHRKAGRHNLAKAIHHHHQPKTTPA